MLDEVLILNEVVDFARKNKNELFLFKVNFEKAFDSVSWEGVFIVYLKANEFGFQVATMYSSLCVCNSSMSILIYESPTVNLRSTFTFVHTSC